MITVWVIILGDSLYSLGYKGGVPGYSTKELADKKIQIFGKHDKEYLKHRGKLEARPLIADKFVLEALKIFQYQEK